MKRQVAGVLVVFILSVFYYALYINKGINIADDGNFAQVAFELQSGTPPQDIQYGYGIFWYKIAEVFFDIFGPRFLVAQAVLFLFMTATAVLVFATVERITGSWGLSVCAGLLAALVPNFAATAFYGFCTALNLYAQTGMALRWRQLQPRDTIFPALAVVVTLLIRADFGLTFALPFTALLVLSAACQGARRGAALLATVLAVLVACAVVVEGFAARGGYLGLMVEDILRFPKLMAHFVVSGLSRTGGAAASATADAGTLLQKPPLSALWLGPWETAAWAFCVYAPLIGLGIYLIVQALAVAREGVAKSGRALDRFVLAATLFAGAVISLPHYFLFRPDLPHVANFMSGYIVLLAVLIWELAGGRTLHAGRGWPLLASRLVAVLLVLSLAGYAIVGLLVPGPASIVRAYGKTEPLRIASGETIYVSAGEKALYDQLRQVIDAHSAPGERIVCLPYCPGVAFISGRRMLFRDYYADDSFLVTKPDWLNEAIAKTKAVRPPVVVIHDWSVNGTNISRFPVWGKPYIDYLLEAGYRPIPINDVTAYVRPDAAPTR